MINSSDLVLRLIDAFDKVGVAYMLAGSHSSSYYGGPGSTISADLVVQMNDVQLTRLRASIGSDFELDDHTHLGRAYGATQYSIVHPRNTYKIDIFLLSEDEHDQARFARRQQVEFEDRLAWLPTAEDVVVTKLRWSKGGRRAKDVEDVEKILAVRSAQLDLPYIRQWTDQHGTCELFEKLLKAVQDLA